MWKHIDLFSGIGGFAYAFREVFKDEGKTVLFCDNDKYCQAVLRKHWPEVPIWGDIRELIANAKNIRYNGRETVDGRYNEEKRKVCKRIGLRNSEITILTGGFPCQPFSQAGKRRGKGDDRFLWPEMLECIRLFKPAWVIAENVYGILSIEGGVVFEQVCTDMEKEGYEVWPFIIPACAVNAPHRRDRVWFVGYSNRNGFNRRKNEINTANVWEQTFNNIERRYSNASISTGKRLERQEHQEGQGSRFNRENWQADWKEVASATCVRGVDDGTSKELYGVSEAKHRTERLKMLGNGIVPQVAMEIMKTIKEIEDGN